MTNRMYTQDEVDHLVREARYKSANHSYGCFICGVQSKGSEKHLVLFCDKHLGLCEVIRIFMKLWKD